jgi:hypothetical protein
MKYTLTNNLTGRKETIEALGDFKVTADPDCPEGEIYFIPKQPEGRSLHVVGDKLQIQEVDGTLRDLTEEEKGFGYITNIRL